MKRTIEERGKEYAENCDIMINGMAIDYYPPTIDHTIQTIEIKQPMIR